MVSVVTHSLWHSQNRGGARPWPGPLDSSGVNNRAMTGGSRGRTIAYGHGRLFPHVIRESWMENVNPIREAYGIY